MEEERQYFQELNAIFKETDAIYSDLAKKSGLPDSVFWLMYTLREANGNCTQKEISDQWAMNKQTVNSALKGLEKSGYITLTVSDSDKRSKHIALTDKGDQFARENIDIVFKFEQLAFQRLTDAERAIMIDSNRRYLELLREETRQYLQK